MNTITCLACQGLGWVRSMPAARPGDPDFGRLVRCVCNPAAPTHTASDLPPRLQWQTFASFIVVDEAPPPQGRGSNRAMQAAASAFAADPHGWLLLAGSVGTGKTHLLAAIAQSARRSSHFLTAPDLLDELRTGYNDDSYAVRFDALRMSPLLLLDDLGAESATDWAEEKLFQLLNYRYNWELPTAIATNLPLEKLPARLRSRLSDRTLVKAVVATVGDVRRIPLTAKA